MVTADGEVPPSPAPPLTSIEICAGAGGQAVGLHNAGFKHLALVEWDPHAVETLRTNVKQWDGWADGQAEKLVPVDVKQFLDSETFKNLDLKPGELDLLAGGVPCPPFSLAGKRLGREDDRDLFPEMLKISEALKPKAILIENVRGILEPPEVFLEYRKEILEGLRDLGYNTPRIDPHASPSVQDRTMQSVWRKLQADNFGVPQLRPRAVLVVVHKDVTAEGVKFRWPHRVTGARKTVHTELDQSMKERCKDFWDKNKHGEPARPGERTGKDVYHTWREKTLAAEAGPSACVAPTLVGGSRKHGGADLGPSRAKRSWADLGVDATGVANDFKKFVMDAEGRLVGVRYRDRVVPQRDLFRETGPMLTVKQAAIIQGFPEEWEFQGGKTARYRQVGNAFPPPVAEAVGRAIAATLRPTEMEKHLSGLEMEENPGPDSPGPAR